MAASGPGCRPGCRRGRAAGRAGEAGGLSHRARSGGSAGREVLVLEAEKAMGTITSSRNSEVIHAGIYYPPGSLKAIFCLAGNHEGIALAAVHAGQHELWLRNEIGRAHV